METSNRFVGSIACKLATPTPLGWTRNTFTGGSLRAEGTRSALVVTATGNAAFRLELDDNGDGAIEAASEANEKELGDLV